ncbi:shikimate dehydrogenase [Pelagibacteraceae bacterium]|nr:shikimate dehydrogenase [Pelagibacteraceae bacterium]MDC0366384.1 shikimate dehydrogenase [Pelagibacteraceae bacterium]|tara:strand:- start:251 stop:1072 length:822 start_codon:yes stop_codon:yes gene_type:complete
MKKKLYAIIGNPVFHSLSPVLHNYWFKKYGIDADYSAMQTSEENLENIVNKIRNKELKGINITLPYKQKIIKFVDQVVNDAQSTNSVNTIFLNENNIIVGENTDVFGLQAAYLKEIINAEDKKILIIGAGGVAPSVIFSLQKSNMHKISIVNRTYDKSIFLKKKFNFLNVLKWKTLEQDIRDFDIIINATSLGLKNGKDFDFNFEGVKDSLIYIDTIYNPVETKTLKFLKRNNIKTFSGLDMLIYQGQKSFYLWNKINPEIDDELVNLLKSKL